MKNIIEGPDDRTHAMEYQKGTVVPMVDLEISGECNLHCPTCWGTPPDMRQEHEFSDWLAMLGKLKASYGLESIALTGGEPLMIPGIDGFIEEAHKEVGLNVNLLTNSVFLGDHFSTVKPHLSSLSIPLDGSSEEVNRKSRGRDHYQVAVDWIARLSREHPELPLKVGTVVSVANFSDVLDIGEVLLAQGFGDRVSNPGTWKLYQATAFGAQQESPIWRARAVTGQDFDQLVQQVTDKFQGRIMVTGLSTSEVGGYCIIVRPNGNIVTNSLQDGREHLLATNIFEDTEGAMESIAAYHVKTRGVQRMATSYLSQGLH
ncbi:radical SAM protein [Patescibacteria group bacterium]|nr:radical SAM protein [Patescibacteria group bacterium]